MRMMQKILSQLFLMCVAVALQVAVMMLGWGLHPLSWWWIVGGGVFGYAALRVLADKIDREGAGSKKP